MANVQRPVGVGKGSGNGISLCGAQNLYFRGVKVIILPFRDRRKNPHCPVDCQNIITARKNKAEIA